MWKWEDVLNNENNITTNDFGELSDKIIESMKDDGFFSDDEISNTKSQTEYLHVGETKYINSKYGYLKVKITRIA